MLYVPDVELAVDFYERAFGLTKRFVKVEGDIGYAEMETESTKLGFVSHSLARSNGVEYTDLPPDQPAAPMEIGLVTDDVAAAHATAVEAGAADVAAPTKKPWGQTVAYVRDLNGFLVEICSPMPE